MKIITSLEEYFKIIKTLARPKAEIRIATYNLFAGVLPDGRYTNDWGKENWHSNVGELLDHLHELDVKVEIKIGKPLFGKCKLQDNVECCMHKKEEKWDDRLGQMDKRWPKFTFQILGISHAKLILFKLEDGRHFSIYGGRNLSDAPLMDLSFVDVDPKIYQKLLKVYETLQ
jgi:hypothetical protein